MDSKTEDVVSETGYETSLYFHISMASAADFPQTPYIDERKIPIEYKSITKALSNFFTSFEIASQAVFHGWKTDVKEMVTEAVTTIRTREVLVYRNGDRVGVGGVRTRVDKIEKGRHFEITKVHYLGGNQRHELKSYSREINAITHRNYIRILENQ